jgi:hypothetical protein
MKSKREKQRAQRARRKRRRAEKAAAHIPVTDRGHRSVGPKKGTGEYPR